jgi:hypothetical protein
MVVNDAGFRTPSMEGALLRFGMVFCTGEWAELIGDAKTSIGTPQLHNLEIQRPQGFLGYLLYRLLLIAPLHSEIATSPSLLYIQSIPSTVSPYVDGTVM